ncbi:hypothetical protein HQ590_04500 [bacterium]|nr:hypothetical protein [bacterium]
MMSKSTSVIALVSVTAALAWLGNACQLLPPREPLYGTRIVVPADPG